MTKARFLNLYRDELSKRYEWAQDAAKLDRFMQTVDATLNCTGPGTWNHEGEAVAAAWWAMGGKGKPTKKALRALPA